LEEKKALSPIWMKIEVNGWYRYPCRPLNIYPLADENYMKRAVWMKKTGQLKQNLLLRSDVNKRACETLREREGKRASERAREREREFDAGEFGDGGGGWGVLRPVLCRAQGEVWAWVFGVWV
jgi:hypothetical protein